MSEIPFSSAMESAWTQKRRYRLFADHGGTLTRISTGAYNADELARLRQNLAVEGCELRIFPAPRRTKRKPSPPVTATSSIERPDGSYTVTTYAPDRAPNRRRHR